MPTVVVIDTMLLTGQRGWDIMGSSCLKGGWVHVMGALCMHSDSKLTNTDIFSPNGYRIHWSIQQLLENNSTNLVNSNFLSNIDLYHPGVSSHRFMRPFQVLC